MDIWWQNLHHRPREFKWRMFNTGTYNFDMLRCGLSLYGITCYIECGCILGQTLKM